MDTRPFRLKRRWFGRRHDSPRSKVIGPTSALLRVPLTEEELNTIVLALTLSKIRYGMLLQLAGQREQAVLPLDTVDDLQASLERILTAAAVTK